MVLDSGDRGLLPYEHAVFVVKILFPFPLVIAKLISDYFDNRQRSANCSKRFPYFVWYANRRCKILYCSENVNTINSNILHFLPWRPLLLFTAFHAQIFWCARWTCSVRKNIHGKIIPALLY